MKKLMLSIVAACGIVPSFAQKGNYLYYGSLGGTAQGVRGLTNNALFINSGLGYQFNDHFTLGVQGGISHFSVKEYGGDEMKNTSYAAGVFGRYTSYIGSRFFVFAQADASYLAKGPTGDGVGLFVRPGAGLNVGKNWALNLSLNAFSTRTIFNEGTTATFNLAQGYYFGVSKGFGAKRRVANVEK